MELNDVSGNETYFTETTEDMDNSEDEVVDNFESEETEAVTVFAAYDYTSDFAILESLGFIEIAVMIAVGCIIAWTGAHRE